MMDTHSVYMFLKSLEAHGVTCDVNIECVGDEQIPGLQVTYQNKFKFFPTPLSALPWMQERYREDLTELLGDLALPLVEKDENMSETPEQYGNEPENVRIEKSLVGLQQSVERLADVMRRAHGIEAPKTLSADERLEHLQRALSELDFLRERLQLKDPDPAARDALNRARACLHLLIDDATKP